MVRLPTVATAFDEAQAAMQEHAEQQAAKTAQQSGG